MRYIRYIFLLAVGFCLLIVALANSAPVAVQLLPDAFASDLGGLLGLTLPVFKIELPLYVLIGICIAVGLAIGFAWEWLREHKIRVDGRRQKREKERLAQEVKGLKKEAHQGDDVLALLD